MRRTRAFVAGLTLLTFVGGLPGATASVVGLPAWDTVPAPSPGTNARFLDVADLGAGAVWAVGNARPNLLAARCTGTKFVRVSVSGISGRDNFLEGVDGIAANDIWAVGHADRTDFVGSNSLIYRWNGTAWTRVPSPNQGDSESRNDLNAVVAISADNAWAVGTYSDFASFRALTLRWDGTAWRNVSNNCGPGLNGVTALAANNVWAVGAGIICRWDGVRWTAQAAPKPPNRTLDLQDIDSGGSALYAVGIEQGQCGEGSCGGGIVLRRSGTSWIREAPGYLLLGVSVLGPSDAWAVGRWAYGSLLLHRNSTIWEPAPPPDTPGYATLEAVSASASNSLFAVGHQLIPSDGSTRTLALKAPSTRSGAVSGETGVGNADVSWFGPENGTTTSDQFGHFLVGGLNAGTYDFLATQQGCSPARRRVNIVAGATIALSLRPTC